MWQHLKRTCPIADRDAAGTMEALLTATTAPDGQRCSLTRLTGAWRKGRIVPDPTEQELKALGLHLVPAVNAVIEEALTGSGATRDHMQRGLSRRRKRG